MVEDDGRRKEDVVVPNVPLTEAVCTSDLVLPLLVKEDGREWCR